METRSTRTPTEDPLLSQDRTILRIHKLLTALGGLSREEFSDERTSLLVVQGGFAAGTILFVLT